MRKLLVFISLCIVPISFLFFRSDNYILELARTIYKANTANILPKIEVIWLQSPPSGSLDIDSTASAALAGRPNIILIIADDLGHNDLSGGAHVDTPHIDSIGRSGAYFTQSYAAHATCAPSRAALLTGRAPSRIGFEFTPTPKFFGKLIGDITRLNRFDFPPIYRAEKFKQCPNMEDISLPASLPLFSEIIKPLGYQNYFIGKWDSGSKSPSTPLDRGYDESLAFLLGAVPYGERQQVGGEKLISAKNSSVDFLLKRITNFQIAHNNGPRFKPDKYMTDYLSSQTASLIKALTNSAHRGKQSKRPWFITLAYNAPHNPFQCLERDYDSTPSHIEHNHRVYAAMIRALDRGVGEVLSALKQAGEEVYNNTIIAFTSDNGGANYVKKSDINAPFRGFKASFFEGGIRVPLLLQWPKQIASDMQVEEPVISMDIVATLFAAASRGDKDNQKNSVEGNDAEDKLFDGQNLLPLFQTSSENNSNTYSMKKKRFLWRSGEYVALRYGNHKVMIHSHPNKIWYFNLLIDPTEHLNIANEVLGLDSASQAQELLYDSFPSRCPGHKILNNFTIIPDLADDTHNMQREALLCQLLSLLVALNSLNEQQTPPIWPSLASVAFCVDKHAGLPCKKGDEYVYFDN